MRRTHLLFFLLAVEGGVIHIIIFAVEFFLGDSGAFGEALIMHDLPLPQKLNGVSHVGIVHHAKDVIVGHPCFLLCCYVIIAFEPYPIAFYQL